MRLVVVSGRSGSGKSVCLHLLEDTGFYCIDNYPAHLLEQLPMNLGSRYDGVAVSIDARNLLSSLVNIEARLNDARKIYTDCQILYLDATDDVLLERFSATRRKHPLTNEHKTLRQAIIEEKELLAPIANMADLVVDTSSLHYHQLRSLLRTRLCASKAGALSILFQSFGYKHGIPHDADFVFDLRVLPNPYWNPELRDYTGLDQPVQAFFQESAECRDFIAHVQAFLERWLPAIIRDNRRYLTIALGCTGGRHRSVFCAESLAKSFQNPHHVVQVHHRDLTT